MTDQVMADIPSHWFSKVVDYIIATRKDINEAYKRLEIITKALERHGIIVRLAKSQEGMKLIFHTRLP